MILTSVSCDSTSVTETVSFAFVSVVFVGVADITGVDPAISVSFADKVDGVMGGFMLSAGAAGRAGVGGGALIAMTGISGFFGPE